MKTGRRSASLPLRIAIGCSFALLLPWLTNPKKAKELILTGNDKLDASEALALGIVVPLVLGAKWVQRGLTDKCETPAETA